MAVKEVIMPGAKWCEAVRKVDRNDPGTSVSGKKYRSFCLPGVPIPVS
jgi:hypothetical protein